MDRNRQVYTHFFSLYLQQVLPTTAIHIATSGNLFYNAVVLNGLLIAAVAAQIAQTHSSVRAPSAVNRLVRVEINLRQVLL